MAVPSEALCPGLPILLIASSQKGEASKGELAPLGQQIWAGHDGQDEWVQQPVLCFFNVSVSSIEPPL